MSFNSVDDYAKMLEEAEKQRKPFRDNLLELLEDFQSELEERYVAKTVRKHTMIIELFIDFICQYTDVTSVQEITRGMVNTHFRKWWKKKVWDSTTDNELRVALKKFFTFLDDYHGIYNEKVLIALK